MQHVLLELSWLMATRHVCGCHNLTHICNVSCSHGISCLLKTGKHSGTYSSELQATMEASDYVIDPLLVRIVLHFGKATPSVVDLLNCAGWGVLGLASLTDFFTVWHVKHCSLSCVT
jgi:hypothetical protein